jgi:hypothetical protein
MTTSDKLLNELLDESRKVHVVVKEKFGSLTFDSLNYRKEKYAWSPAECFDHLIVTNNQYIPLIENALDARSEKKGNKEFRTTFAGRFLLYSVNPQNMKKMKAPRLYRPEIKLYTKEVIKFFLDQNNQIISLMCKSEGKDLSSIRIHSPVTKLLRFNLGECFQIIVQQDWRHINQAKRILGIQ